MNLDKEPRTKYSITRETVSVMRMMGGYSFSVNVDGIKRTYATYFDISNQSSMLKYTVGYNNGLHTGIMAYLDPRIDAFFVYPRYRDPYNLNMVHEGYWNLHSRRLALLNKLMDEYKLRIIIDEWKDKNNV